MHTHAHPPQPPETDALSFLTHCDPGDETAPVVRELTLTRAIQIVRDETLPGLERCEAVTRDICHEMNEQFRRQVDAVRLLLAEVDQ